MDNEQLVFELAQAKNKPHSYRKVKGKKPLCPFCSVDKLTDIYQMRDDMIWLQNKFPTLRDAQQTVLIEASDHNGDIATYSQAYNRQLLRFAYDCFSRMNNLGHFKSVVWYKNLGPHSGGSLSHPHMQIVGFDHLDAYQNITSQNFIGVTVFHDTKLDINVATYPVQGYAELNFNLLALPAIDKWADWLQYGVKYMLQVMFDGRCDSYNLFFYPRADGGICAKLISRFATPPYFVGYKLSQVNDEHSLEQEANRFWDYYCAHWPND